jgi:hypothetical protein
MLELDFSSCKIQSPSEKRTSPIIECSISAGTGNPNIEPFENRTYFLDQDRSTKIDHYIQKKNIMLKPFM